MPDQDNEFLSAANDVAGNKAAAPDNTPPIPASTPSQDPYLDAAREVVGDQAARIRNNLVSAQGANPAEESRVQQLASSTGMPVDAVRAQPDAAQTKATLANTDADALVQKFPHLAQFMSKPENAAQVHTFVPEMAHTEEAIKAFPVAQPNAKPGSFFDSFLHTLSAAAPTEELAALGKEFAGSYNRAASAVNLVLGAFPTMYDKLADAFTGRNFNSPNGSAASDWWFRNMVEPTIARQSRYATPTDASFMTKAFGAAGNMLGSLNQIILTGGEAAAVPATATTGEMVGTMAQNAAKSMAFPAVTSAVNTGQQVYAETGDAHQALLAAQEDWLANTAMGAVPLAAPGNLAQRLLTGAASGMAFGEVSRQAANVVMPESMQQDFSLEQLILSGLSGAIMGGAMGPRTEEPMTEAVRKTYTDALAAQKTEQDMQNLHMLGAVAEANPLRKNNPDAFHQFVQTMADERNLTDVYVNANTLNAALKSDVGEGQAFLQKAPDVAAQLQEQASLNGDIRIPLADYATYIAGKPLESALLPHLKVSPEGMTYAEGQSYFQNATAEMKAQADKILNDKTLSDQQKAEQQEVHDTVLQQLNNVNRFPADVNKVYAAITAAGYASRAKAAGMSVRDLWARHPLNVEGGAYGIGADQATSLQQTAPRSNVTLTGEQAAPDWQTKTAIRRNGEPVVLYHGGDREMGKEIFGNLGKSTGNAISGLGAQFTENHAEARTYGDTVEAFHVDVRKPKVLPFDSPQLDFKNAQEAADYRKQLETEGYDGMLLKGPSGPGSAHVIAFRPDQVIKQPIRPEAAGLDFTKGYQQAKQTAQEGTSAFKKWAGTEKPVIEPHEVNDYDFSGEGPFVVRAYHGTTNEFDTFDASVKGNKEGQFGAVNYFTSSEHDAARNYAGEGPDLTKRIELKAERLADEITDTYEKAGGAENDAKAVQALKNKYGEDVYSEDHMEMARNIVRGELHGGQEKVMEVFIKTENPFVVGDESTPWMEFFDHEQVEKNAVERVADNEGLSIEEIEANRDTYQDQIDEARYEIMDEQENKLAEAVQTVARKYDFDPSELMNDIYEMASDGGVQHSRVEEMLRGNESLSYAEHPDSGELIQSQIIGEVIHELGFDSIILKNAEARFKNMDLESGTVHIHVFDQDNTHIKSATENRGTFDINDPNIYRQAKPAFYSALERTIPELKNIAGKDGTVDTKQAKAWLDARQKEGKFKKAEVEATGLDDWLKLQGNRVSVADVENFIKQGGVQVKDVMLGAGDITMSVKGFSWGEPNKTQNFTQYTLRSVGEDGQPLRGSVGSADEARNLAYIYEEDGKFEVEGGDASKVEDELVGTFDTLEEAKHAAANLAPEDLRVRVSGKATETKYESWQLPGGENYRELLLTLPSTKSETLHQIGQRLFGDDKSIYDRPKEQQDAMMAEYNKQSEAGKKEFRSGHFDQPNILAHIRFNERADAEGKRVLFLEELQSDWGQKGKKEGFAQQVHEYKIQANPSRGTWDVLDHNGNRLDSYTTKDQAQRVVDESKKQTTGVPSAPFVTDTKAWTALALKRMIRYAAENGFDKVAWTTGEQQAARYDLSKQVEKVSAWRMDDERRLYDLHVTDSAGKMHKYSDIPEPGLEDLVGKELGKKIAESPEVSDKGVHLAGLDLKIGGEGMKGYYDKIVPQVANDVLKKLGGGKVGEIEMVSERGRPTQYADYAEYSKAPEETRTKQQSIEITPAMRDAVMEGQPLFQEAHAAYVPDTATIHLLKDANLSSFTHELGHHFLEMTDQLADASPAIRKDMDTLLGWFGKTADEWKGMTLEERRPFHEKFAESFERYLLEGKAPSLELRPVFERVRNWMVSVYKSLQGLLSARPQAEQLNPEVRQVFDRMLATEDAIKQAEAVKNYEPLFRSVEEAKAAGMSEAAYRDYITLGERATSQAISEMERKAMADMQWLSGAKSRMLREMQREAASKRREIRDEVTKEVEATPIEQAYKALHESEIKMSAKDLRARGYTAEEMAKLRGMVSEDGLPPDMAAEALGFQSSDVLLHGLLTREDPTHAIDGLTDQRMLERYGELSDPQAIERAANQAIANTARARFMATGLKVLTKSPVSASALAKAAQAVAEQSIGGKKIKDLHPALYDIQEAKANKAALKAAPKDPQAAVKSQREALLNNRMSRAANDAISDVRKGLDYLKRFSKDSIRGKIDVDIRDQIDDLLERFDLRQTPSTAPTRGQLSLRDWVASQEAAGYTPLVTPDMADPAVRMHYKEMTVDQFRGLHDTVKALEHIGRERKYATIAGQRTDVNEYVRNELAPKILSRGVKFTPEELVDRPELRYTNPIAIAFDHFNSWRRAVAAELMPQSQKANFYDRHEILGPFNQAITSRIMDANYNKVRMLKGLSDDFAAQAKELGKDWQKSLRDSVRNDKLMDPDTGKPLTMTRGRMIGMAIHVGNESNFHKLTAGWNLRGEDVWSFLHTNMSEKDWKAVQAVWDLYEKHWPEVDAMNRRLGNTSPQKIEARPFKTQFGDMRGGYAAISYDPLRSRRGERAAAGEAINPSEGLFGRGYFRADTTTNGSLNARQENYVDRVDLDFHSIPQRLQETIHDLAYREALIDVNKIIEHPEFRKAVRMVHGREAYKSMQDWLGNLANASNQDQQIGALGRFLQYTRTGMVVNAIAYRASTVIKHGGSALFKSAGYFAGGGEKYFARRVAAMGTNYTQEIEGAQRKFGEIFARMLQQDRDFKQTSNSMFEPESLQSKGERFGHAMVAWSDMMSAVPTAWAAYDRAITEGIPVSQGGTGEPMTEAQAVDYANRIVREAHGSYTEAGRSLVLSTKSEAMKMFTTLYSFMNNAYGQQLDGFDKLRTAGISNAPVLARTFAAIIVPAIVAGYVKSGLPSENDVEGWAEWVGESIADEVAATVPFVRDAVSMVEGYQHAGMVAAENWLSALVLAGKDLVKGTGKPIRDIANAIGMALHIPGLGQLGSSAQYVADVEAGKKTPQSKAELVKGVIVGH